MKLRIVKYITNRPAIHLECKYSVTISLGLGKYQLVEQPPNHTQEPGLYARAFKQILEEL